MRMRGAGHIARMGRRKIKIGFWWGSQKRLLGRPICRWENNIKMDLREIGWGCMDWINMAQDRDKSKAFANTAMNLRVS
jgi:hypothetical protein